MSITKYHADLTRIFDELGENSIESLKNLVSDDIDWCIDWKGEGIFGGGPLFGRHFIRGPSELVKLFNKIFQTINFSEFQVVDFVSDGGDAVVALGRTQWKSLDAGSTHTSDWTMRLNIREGKIVKSRLMVLPENHIRTFIEDDESYDFYTSESGIIDLVDKFQKLYFDAYLFGRTWSETYFLGIPVFKCPLDLWLYQELIFKMKPDLIIETGTNYGGSALYFATMCELAGHGEVVSIDISHIYADGNLPKHDRTTYLLGSSTSDEIIEQVREMSNNKPIVFVILDSDHHKDHVLEELHKYHEFVTVGSYLVVEDTNLNGRPVKPNFGPGPMEAIEEFMKINNDFVIDREMEKYYMTSNPGGFLLKVK